MNSEYFDEKLNKFLENKLIDLKEKADELREIKKRKISKDGDNKPKEN